MIQKNHNIPVKPVSNNNVIPISFGKATPEEKIIQRQDLVDNAVFFFLCKTTQTKKWEISVISEVREAIGSVLDSRGIMTEDEFYPSFQDKSEDYADTADLDSLPIFIKRAFRETGKMNWDVYLTVCLFLFVFFVLLVVWR